MAHRYRGISCVRSVHETFFASQAYYQSKAVVWSCLSGMTTCINSPKNLCLSHEPRNFVPPRVYSVFLEEFLDREASYDVMLGRSIATFSCYQRPIMKVSEEKSVASCTFSDINERYPIQERTSEHF